MKPSVIYDFDPRNLPREYLEALGLISTSSAQTEHVVEMAIAGCLGIDSEYMYALTTHMAAPLRDNILRAVAEIRIEQVNRLNELDIILDAIKSAFVCRNRYVHRGWCRHPTTGQVYAVKIEARGTVEADLVPMTVDEIKADAEFIYGAGMELMDFLIDLDLLPPFPPAGRARSHKTKAARKALRKDGLPSRPG